MAGQDMQRREVLRILGIAAVASHFPGFVNWAYANEHADPQASARGAGAGTYLPQYFTAPEYALVETLTALIIPSDDTPGAREAGVAEFVDFMVAHDDEQRGPMRSGLAWLNQHCERNFGKQFIEVSPEQQRALLEPLAYQAKFRAGEEPGREFFRRLRELTIMGFYSSRIGYEELDNPSLRLYPQSPACPHPGDPAHQHLPPPKW
jgi:hypothetical protein